MRSGAVSSTLEVAFGVEALEPALRQGQPEILHTDQGAQVTPQAFTVRRQNGGVRVSLDGRGRALDTVLVERLWRRVQDEAVYRREYHRVGDARPSLARDVAFDHGGTAPSSPRLPHTRGGLPWRSRKP